MTRLTSTPPTSPIADLLGRYWQNRFKVTAAFLAILLGTAGFTAISEPTYRSITQLNVRVGRNSAVLDPTITTGQFVAVADPREAEINAVADLIVSRGILEAVISDIGENKIRGKKEGQTSSLGTSLGFLNGLNLNPFRVYSTQDDAVKKLAKTLKVKTMRNSAVITISYDAKTPELAHDVLASLIKHVQERHNQVNQTHGSHQYFVEELKKSKEHLTNLENARAEFKTHTSLSDLSTQQKQILERIRFLQDAIGDTKTSLAAIETEVAVRTKMLESLPVSIVTEETTGEVNSSKDNMREELFRLETREKELLSKFTEESIYVKQIRDQLAQARAVVASESRQNKVTRGVSKPNEEMQISLNNARAQRQPLEARLDELTAQLKAEKSRLQLINENEKEFIRLDREIRMAETQYLDFHKAYQQTLVDQGMEEQKITNINELQPPTFKQTPESPQPLVNLAFGLGLSVFATLGIVSMSKRREEEEAAEARLSQRQPTAPAANTENEPASALAARPDADNGEGTTDPLDDLLEPSTRRPLPR